MKSFLSSSNPSARSKWTYAILSLALAGLADAVYLTASHYAGGAVSCSVLHGCEQVLTSKYAAIGGIPIAAFGAGYYAALFLLAYYGRLGSSAAWRLLQLTIASGVAVTAALLYIQLAVIRAVCQYCMLSAILTTMIAIIALALSMRKPNETVQQ
jgi:uncharacterized membrane protein